MLKTAIKETVIDLAMAGLERCVLSYIEKNPYRRMHMISEDCFGLIDHKQMLASVVVRHLVENNKVIKYQPPKYVKGEALVDSDGNLIRYKHFVYVAR